MNNATEKIEGMVELLLKNIGVEVVTIAYAVIDNFMVTGDP